MAASLHRRIIRAAGWRVARRMLKPMPMAGQALALGLAGYEIKKKGLVRGAVHVALDLTPILGTAKGLVEMVTGDLIPDRE